MHDYETLENITKIVDEILKFHYNVFYIETNKKIRRRDTINYNRKIRNINPIILYTIIFVS